MMTLRHAALALLPLSLAGATVSAQQPPFKRTMLQRADLSVPGHEVVQAIGEFPAQAASGRHSHPGDEVGYVLEGKVVVEIDGRAPMTLGPGAPFLIPAGEIHNARNVGKGTLRVLSTYVLAKGQPLAIPAK